MKEVYIVVRKTEDSALNTVDVFLRVCATLQKANSEKKALQKIMPDEVLGVVKRRVI